MQAAAAQRNTVAVLQRLPEFGVSLLPAQLTALPDKRQLLHSVLLCRTTATAAPGQQQWGGGSSRGVRVAPWRRLGDVLELAALLGFNTADDQQEVSGHGVFRIVVNKQ